MPRCDTEFQHAHDRSDGGAAAAATGRARRLRHGVELGLRPHRGRTGCDREYRSNSARCTGILCRQLNPVPGPGSVA